LSAAAGPIVGIRRMWVLDAIQSVHILCCGFARRTRSTQLRVAHVVTEYSRSPRVPRDPRTSESPQRQILLCVVARIPLRATRTSIAALARAPGESFPLKEGLHASVLSTSDRLAEDRRSRPASNSQSFSSRASAGCRTYNDESNDSRRLPSGCAFPWRIPMKSFSVLCVSSLVAVALASPSLLAQSGCVDPHHRRPAQRYFHRLGSPDDDYLITGRPSARGSFPGLRRSLRRVRRGT